MSLFKLSAVASGLVLSDAAMTCKKFSEVYSNGEATAGIWGDALLYETDEANAYDVWFLDAENNPNDLLTKTFVQDGTITDANGHFDEDGLVDKCYLDYSHKNLTAEIDNNVHPLSDPEDFTICTPWATRSCCTHDTVNEIAEFKQLFADWYGAGTEDCGELSAACQSMFVQQECFYSCEPNAGLYRQYTVDGAPVTGNNALVYDEANDDHDEWSMKGMPTKASYWDAFYVACKDDMLSVEVAEDEDDEEDEESSGLALSAPFVGIAAAALAAFS